MQEPLRTPLFDQNPKKIEKQQVEMATETVKKKEVDEELSLEETAKRIAKYLANAHRIKDTFEPILRKIWPDIETITVYELIEDVKNLDFEGCDCLIKFKDGTKIHAALRENRGGDNWYTQASMLRRNSVRRHEGKAIQSIEIQIFKENNQIHILDSDEVYKIAHEFQKHNKLEGFCEKLDEMAKERNIFKYKFYKYANWVTKDSENPNPPEREDAIRIKYFGYENFTNLDNVPQNPKVVEVLHKWEKYNLNGQLIKKGSQGVDLHCEEYKEKTKKLKEMFPKETRLVDEKEATQNKKELFAIHNDPESDNETCSGGGIRYGRLFGGSSKNTNSEKGANRMNTFIDPDTIQKLEGLEDICVGYDPKADTFVIFDDMTKDVWARAADIDELNEILDDKIVQMLETGEFSDNEKVMDILEELEALEDSDDVQEKEDQVNDLKGELYKIAGEIAAGIDFEELEIQAAISRERDNGDSDSNGDSRTPIPSTA